MPFARSDDYDTADAEILASRLTRVISQAVLDEVVRLLVADGRPSRIILFGSHARGDAHVDSDLDLMVVLPEIHGRMTETNRLLRLLRPLRLPVEVVVATEAQLEEWGASPVLFSTTC